MHTDNIVFVIFLIFSGAAALATVALYARQALLVAYIALGVAVGPWGFELIEDTELVSQIADLGIIFLLFLLGLDLKPQDLLQLLRKATTVTLLSSGSFAVLGFAMALIAGFNGIEALIIGACLMFSSTIIGLKLLPTTVLHHQHMGEFIIAILLLQDIIAIGILLALEAYAHTGVSGSGLDGLVKVLIGIPVLAGVAYGFGRWVLSRLFMRFDTIREYVFLVTIGWCMGMAELAGVLGLSHEIGAFLAGITLASSPISQYIAEHLKPLRDFFLVIFFFSLGAGFDLGVLAEIWLPASVLAAIVLLAKPLIFRQLFLRSGERPRHSLEMGVRLGQVSEFALLVAVLALHGGVIGERASYFIQAVTLLTFIASSYYIVMRYPTPIAVTDALRRD